MLNWLKEFFMAFWGQVVDVLTWIFGTIITVLSDILYFIVDGILLVIEAAIQAIDFTVLESMNAFSGWDLLPPQVIYILDVMDIGTCLSVLAAAYGIRLLLNLIPAAFTRV